MARRVSRRRDAAVPARDLLRFRVSIFVLLIFLPFSPAGAQGYREKGASLLAEGSYDEARQLALEALARDKADSDAAILLCQSLLALGRADDAANQASLSYGLRKDPRVAEVLGEALYALGRNGDALAAFRSYLAALPEGPRAGIAYYYTGELYLRLGRFAHADMALSAAVTHLPGNARWWSRLGWAREKAGDYSAALSSYRSALDIDPRLEEALLGRDRSLARLRG